MKSRHSPLQAQDTLEWLLQSQVVNMTAAVIKISNKVNSVLFVFKEKLNYINKNNPVSKYHQNGNLNP